MRQIKHKVIKMQILTKAENKYIKTNRKKKKSIKHVCFRLFYSHQLFLDSEGGSYTF